MLLRPARTSLRFVNAHYYNKSFSKNQALFSLSAKKIALTIEHLDIYADNTPFQWVVSLMNYHVVCGLSAQHFKPGVGVPNEIFNYPLSILHFSFNAFTLLVKYSII